MSLRRLALAALLGLPALPAVAEDSVDCRVAIACKTDTGCRPLPEPWVMQLKPGKDGGIVMVLGGEPAELHLLGQSGPTVSYAGVSVAQEALMITLTGGRDFYMTMHGLETPGLLSGIGTCGGAS